MKKMTVGELATILQTWAHDGWADRPVYISVLDAFYGIDTVRKGTTGNESENDKVFFTVDADRSL